MCETKIWTFKSIDVQLPSSPCIFCRRKAEPSPEEQFRRRPRIILSRGHPVVDGR